MAATLPSYIASAQPVPPSARAPWYKNTAPSYAGIFLWFVFWDSISGQGLVQGGLWSALLGVVLGGVICHALFYVVPAMLGMKTGLPLYVVGSSTFGTTGGLIMPGFLMGILQFGWLGVNTYYSSQALAGGAGGPAFYAICVLFAGLAAFVGLRGIQYLGKVATYLPIIPLAVLVIALVQFGGSATGYKPPAEAAGAGFGIGIVLMVAHIVGFFATAGAAGVDFGMNSRDARDVQWGGIVGILVAIVFTAGASVIAIAGAHAAGVLDGSGGDAYQTTHALSKVLSAGFHKAVMVGLTIAAFPGACFSAFIAANSFKTVMPKVDPFLSVGIGTLVSILLAVTGIAGNLPGVFNLIGASFGPIVGAMTVDYLLAGRKWAGPRPGWNVAGWIAWACGFAVGISPRLHELSSAIPEVPCAPVAAFVAGAVAYLVFALAGLGGPAAPKIATASSS